LLLLMTKVTPEAVATGPRSFRREKENKKGMKKDKRTKKDSHGPIAFLSRAGSNARPNKKRRQGGSGGCTHTRARIANTRRHRRAACAFLWIDIFKKGTFCRLFVLLKRGVGITKIVLTCEIRFFVMGAVDCPP
jgi:hypothetical protein